MIRGLALSILTLLPSIALCDTISLLGVNNLSKPTASDSSYSAKSAIGAGAFYEFNFSDTYALELGVVDVDRKYQNDTNTIQYTQKMIQLPLLFRIHLGSNLAFGLGGYFSFFPGDYKTEYLSNGTSTTTSYDAAGLKKTDYGAVSSFAYFYPLSERFNLVGEVRDNLGIKDNRVNTSLPKLHVNDIQFFLGARLEL